MHGSVTESNLEEDKGKDVEARLRQENFVECGLNSVRTLSITEHPA